ncbi:hypothetical protein PAQ31011_01485 [Pandoraea aquatica]|uniref:Uncharacterized protein n=1 Tax=Pandoraea aquatica TaxID=2508290 RepID=A0A5E4TJV1_9BURK|nr:hypothetical protein [Pandoraea aquatica]VVD88180.1 hypothetical protein PAQ31011_01485 [Pandoraea aquatica]
MRHVSRWRRRAAMPIELRDTRTRVRCIAVVVITAVLVGAWQLWHDVQALRVARQQTQTLTHALASAEQRWRRETRAGQAAMASGESSTSTALSLIDRLGPALSPDVALRRLEATPATNTVTLAFESRDVTSMIAFATRLEPMFDIQWHRSAPKTTATTSVVEASMTLKLRERRGS